MENKEDPMMDEVLKETADLLLGLITEAANNLLGVTSDMFALRAGTWQLSNSELAPEHLMDSWIEEITDWAVTMLDLSIDEPPDKGPPLSASKDSYRLAVRMHLNGMKTEYLGVMHAKDN